MDEMEMKEEQETVTEEIEETVEEVAAEEGIAEENPAEEIPVETAAEKGGSGIIGIVVGFALLIAMLVLVWMTPVGGNIVRDTGVLYAKDNDLYVYDLKNEPYLLQEGISAGGGYNYFYSAWGAGVSQDNEEVFYTADVQADGTYELYYKNLKSDMEAVSVIPGRVNDHTVSKNGDKAAIIQQTESGMNLWVSDGEDGWIVSSEMALTEDAYAISDNGKYLAYKDAYGILSATTTDAADAPIMALTDDCPLYALTDDALYFVSKVEGMYNIYSYDFENEPVLVAENAQYMELMPNGKDLLYGVKPTEIIPYSELLEDDMAEIDAAMKEDDPNYEQKLMRDTLREAMKSGEGLEPLMQEFYILSNGKATLVADNVVSAVAVADSEQNFVTGYKARPFQPLYLSVIGGGLEMVDMIYYMSLNYGGMEPFLADANGNVEVLTGSGVLPNTVKVSSDGSKAAYLATDEATGSNVLMEMEIGKAAEATAWEKNVEEFAYLGRSNELGYSFDYNNGSSIVRTDGVEHTMYAEGACGIQFVTDRQELYFIQYPDSTTGNGTLKGWKNEAYIDIDEDVFAFQYKGNGKLAYIKNYDLNTGLGDLYYFDGSESRLLDTDITAIFMY